MENDHDIEDQSLKTELGPDPSVTVLTTAVRDEQLHILHRSLPNSFVEEDGTRFIVDEGVFSPLVGFTSKMMAAVIPDYAKHCQVAADVGCGSGYLAIKLAKAGVPHVYALDNFLPAIQCAGKNLQYNQDILAGRNVEILESDLFSAVPMDVQFDGVWYNHPFYPGDGSFGLGGDGGKEGIINFLHQVKDRLRDNGFIIMSFADFVPSEHNPAVIAETMQFRANVISQKNDGQHCSYVYEMRKAKNV